MIITLLNHIVHTQQVDYEAHNNAPKYDFQLRAHLLKALSSSSWLLVRMTPMEAAPLMGLMTAGKPTWAAALATSASETTCGTVH